jgi:hypothetical protein
MTVVSLLSGFRMITILMAAGTVVLGRCAAITRIERTLYGEIYITLF